MHHQNGPKNGPKMDPKMDPKWTQNGPKMDPTHLQTHLELDTHVSEDHPFAPLRRRSIGSGHHNCPFFVGTDPRTVVLRSGTCRSGGDQTKKGTHVSRAHGTKEQGQIGGACHGSRRQVVP